MSTNVTSKPMVKPLKGAASGATDVVFDTLVAGNLEIPGLFEDSTIFNIVIEDSVINNTIIGVDGDTIGYFSELTVNGDTFLMNNLGDIGVYWDSQNNIFNINTDLKVTGCSILGNLEICENYIKAINNNGDVQIIPDGFGTIFLQGPITNFASNGNFSSTLKNGNFQVTASDYIKLTSEKQGVSIGSLQAQNYTTLNGDINLTTGTGTVSKLITNIKQTIGNVIVTTSTNSNLVVGDVVNFSGTDSFPLFDGDRTIGTILTPTTFLVSGSVTTQASTGTLLKYPNNDITLNAERYVVIPDNNLLVFRDSSNAFYGNTQGLFIDTNKLYLDAPNTYIAQGDILNFGTNGTLMSSGGSLNVNSLSSTKLTGPLTSINTSNVSFTDPILTIANYTSSLSDPTDRGIEFPYVDSLGNSRLGWFGYKKSIDAFTFIPNATNNSEVISGSSGNVYYSGLVVNNIAITGSNASFNAGCGDIINVKNISGCSGTINILGTDNVNISSSNILLYPGNDILIPANKALKFGTSGSYILGQTGANLVINSVSAIDLNTSLVSLTNGSVLSFNSGSTTASYIVSNTIGTLSVVTSNVLNLSSGSVSIPINSNINLGSTSNTISGNTNGILVTSTKITENVSGEVFINSALTRTNFLTFDTVGSGSITVASNGNLTISGKTSGSNNLVFNDFTSLFIPDYTSLLFDTSGSLTNSTSGINFTLSSSLNVFSSSGNVNVSTANFNVNGSGSTNINTVNTTFRDPILTLSSLVTTTNDLKDRGIEYNYVPVGTTVANLGWFGYKNSTDKFTFYSEAVNNGEIVTGTLGTIEVGNIIINSNNFAVNNINLNCGTIANVKTITACGGVLDVLATSRINVTTSNLYVTGEVNTNSIILTPTSGMSIIGNTSGVLTINGTRTVINGDLQVNGTTSNVYSTVTNIQDPIFSIGGVTGPLVNDLKDRGIEFKYYTSSTKTGFFGYKNSLDRFVVIKDGTNVGEVFTGPYSDIQVGDIYSGQNIYGPTSISNTSGNLTLAPTGYTNISGALYFDNSTSIFNTNGNLSFQSSTFNFNGDTIRLGTGGSGTSTISQTSSGNLTITNTSGNTILNASNGNVQVNTEQLQLQNSSYLSFGGSTSNSVYSDGTKLYLNGYEQVVISPELSVGGDVYIGGTLHVANFDTDLDLNKYILPLGTEQRLFVNDISNSSTTGVLSITTTLPHYFVPGDSVDIRNTTSVPDIDGAYSINTIIDSDTFTILHADITTPGTNGAIAGVLTYDHAKDVGIQVNFWSTKNATSATSGSVNYQTGFFGFKKSLERMTYYHDATISNNVVVSGNLGDFQVDKVFTNKISGFILEGSVTCGNNNISGTNFTIGGGTINATTIGNTTPSSGRFTTLTNTLSATFLNTRMNSTLSYTPDRYTLSSGSPTGSPSASTTVTFISVTGMTFTGSGTMPSTGLSDGQLKVLVCSSLGTDCKYNLAFASGTLVTPKPCTGPSASSLEFKRAGQSIQIIWDGVSGFWVPVSSGVYVR